MTTKKQLFQLDTDPIPSTFDNVVGYDGSADRSTCLSGVTSIYLGARGRAMVSRGPKGKMDTPLCVGGSDVSAGAPC